MRGVVLISLPFFASRAEGRAQLAGASAMTRLQIEYPAAAWAVCQLICRARPLVRWLMPALDREVGPAAARDALDHTWASVSRTLDEVVLGMRPAALLDQIPAERLLFVHADDDHTAPVQRVAAYVAARPGTTLLRLADGGHHPYLRHPHLTCSAIEAFIDRLGPDAIDSAHPGGS